MYYIAVYNVDENHLGWIDSQGKLTKVMEHRAGFSSRDTVDEVCNSIEAENPDWYTEVES